MEVEVNNITLTSNLMFLSTNSGVYTKNEKSVQEFGMHNKNIIHVSEVNPGKYVGAVQATDFGSGDTTIFLKEGNENNWKSYMSNFGGEGKYTWISSMLNSKEQPDLILATGGGTIARSQNAGESWDAVFNKWGTVGFINFLVFESGSSQVVWAGGSNAIFKPILLQSTNAGVTWEVLFVNEIGEGEVFDLIVHDKRKNNLMISLGAVLKSSNSGQTWNSIFNEAAIYAFTHSAANPEIVYASGNCFGSYEV